jgi:hypothetical protein
MEHPTERAGGGPGGIAHGAQRTAHSPEPEPALSGEPCAVRHFVRWRTTHCPHGNVIETAREHSEDGEHWKTLYRFSMVNPPPCEECSAQGTAHSAQRDGL